MWNWLENFLRSAAQLNDPTNPTSDANLFPGMAGALTPNTTPVVPSIRNSEFMPRTELQTRPGPGLQADPEQTLLSQAFHDAATRPGSSPSEAARIMANPVSRNWQLQISSGEGIVPPAMPPADAQVPVQNTGANWANGGILPRPFQIGPQPNSIFTPTTGGPLGRRLREAQMRRRAFENSMTGGRGPVVRPRGQSPGRLAEPQEAPLPARTPPPELANWQPLAPEQTFFPTNTRQPTREQVMAVISGLTGGQIQPTAAMFQGGGTQPLIPRAR